MGASLMSALVMIARGSGQAPPTPQVAIAFDAASIKQNTSGAITSFVGRQPGGRFAATNATLGEFVRYAWQLQPFQLQGGPPWLETDRWDIAARLATIPAPASSQLDETIRAVQNLLEDRFKLVAHREIRELATYALVLARADRTLGPEMRRSTLDCATLMATRSRGGPPPAPPPSGGPPCGLSGRIGSIRSGGVPLSELAQSLSSRVQRTVVDRTGLSGNWDFVLTYASDSAQIAPGVLAPGDPPPPPDANAGSLFTALREQLGLKLESAKGPVEVLVIDSGQKPVED